MKGKLAKIHRHVPKGMTLPPGFDDFLCSKPPAWVEWSNLHAHELKRSALEQAVPFLKLYDGGIVALWYHVDTPAVVHIGSEGQFEVVAIDFDNFLKSINVRRSGLGDFDDEEETFRAPGIAGKPKRAGLAALQKKFTQWQKLHTALLLPLDTRETHALRRHVIRLVKAMVGDGLCHAYTISSWWSVDFRIKRAKNKLGILYHSFGRWYKVPEKYGLIKEVETLLTMVKNKKRPQYELSVSRSGVVSINNDRELVLVPPEKKSD